MLTDITYATALKITREGISNADNNANHVYATDGSIADLTQYAKKAELPVVPTKVSQLTNDSNFITAADVDFTPYATRDFVTAGLSAKQNKITVNTVDITDIETADVTKLRTIVTNLINALISSGLINATDGVE